MSILNLLIGENEVEERKKKIHGRVVLMKKNLLDFVDLNGSVVDRVDELLRKRVSLQLISSTLSGIYSFAVLLYFSRRGLLFLNLELEISSSPWNFYIR